VDFTRNTKPKIMIHWKKILTLFARGFLYSLIVILMDTLMIFVLSSGVDTFVYTLSFVMLIEGGLGLLFGSVVVSYSPSTAKLSEVLLHSKPWNLTQQKEIEKQMEAVIITGLLLVIEALLVSAL
jgi:hypothetical protein